MPSALAVPQMTMWGIWFTFGYRAFDNPPLIRVLTELKLYYPGRISPIVPVNYQSIDRLHFDLN